jgi:hypothetical protein
MNTRAIPVFEQNASSEVKALLAAYREATGLAVTLSYERGRVLDDLVMRGMTGDDIREVVRYIKIDLRSPRPRFNDASLQFTNLLGKPDVFEDRALACREVKRRKEAARPRPPVAQTDAIGTSRLVEASPTAPRAAGTLLAGALRQIAEQVEKKAEGDRP